MSRKQAEQVELYYKLNPGEREKILLPDDIEVVITSATIEEMAEAVKEQSKKRGWLW
jgi:hypothetical protein